MLTSLSVSDKLIITLSDTDKEVNFKLDRFQH